MKPLLLTLALLLPGCYATGGGYGGGGYYYPTSTAPVRSMAHSCGCRCSSCCGPSENTYNSFMRSVIDDHQHGFGGMFERGSGDPRFAGYGWEGNE